MIVFIGVPEDVSVKDSETPPTSTRWFPFYRASVSVQRRVQLVVGLIYPRLKGPPLDHNLEQQIVVVVDRVEIGDQRKFSPFPSIFICRRTVKFVFRSSPPPPLSRSLPGSPVVFRFLTSEVSHTQHLGRRRSRYQGGPAEVPVRPSVLRPHIFGSTSPMRLDFRNTPEGRKDLVVFTGNTKCSGSVPKLSTTLYRHTTVWPHSHFDAGPIFVQNLFPYLPKRPSPGTPLHV